MKMKLELTYDIAREIRGIAETIFLANITPDSVGLHTDDCMRVLCRMCDQLVEEIETVMNEKESTEKEKDIRSLVNGPVEVTADEIKLLLKYRSFSEAGKKSAHKVLDEISMIESET